MQEGDNLEFIQDYVDIKIVVLHLQVMGTIQRVLLAISHSGNLAIYCISSRKFRSVLGKKMFGFLRKNQEQNFQMENLQISQFITRDISSAKMNDEKLL